jgi:hypothetical protein
MLVMSGVVSVMGLFTSGCKSVLPTEKSIAESRWETFEGVHADYEKVIPQQSTTNDLKELGFDPYLMPNIKILNYIDLVQRFLPNASVSKEDLPKPVRLALEAKDAARAYEVDLESIKTKRFGNAFLDVFSFRRRARTTGWNYKALFVLKDDLVVYKLWSGAPNINKLSDKKRPLGPLQEVDIQVGVPGW